MISKSKVKVYWRSKLYSLLRSPSILQGIFVGEAGHLEFLLSDWKDYWEDCDLTDKYSDALDALHRNWRLFIESGFHSQLAETYCASYFHLLKLALENEQHDLLAKLISFESFYVINQGGPYTLCCNDH